MAMLLRVGSSCRVARVWRTTALVAGGLGGAALLVFHAWLLWLRASQGSILDAEVGLRWGVSALLLGAVLGFRRLGLSPLRGRNAIVLGAFVAMLHWSAGGPETRLVALDSDAAREALFLLPSVVAATAGALLVFLCGIRAQRRPAVVCASAPPVGAAAALRARGGCVFAPRPPPA
jgi:hypothetical protein